ncbi:hypothetical protein A2U01_0053688, partial [Trifolium medium]|nr:hypothetical protein [Trifolium medium]
MNEKKPSSTLLAACPLVPGEKAKRAGNPEFR